MYSVSKHYSYTRPNRERVISRFLNGDGNVIDSFEINNAHKHGLEIHSVTDNGLIIIRNKLSGKLITKLIARPEQIERYYSSENKTVPKWLLQLAAWHQGLHYNLY